MVDHLYEHVHVDQKVGHIDRPVAGMDLVIDDTVMDSQQVPVVLNQLERQPHLV